MTSYRQRFSANQGNSLPKYQAYDQYHQPSWLADCHRMAMDTMEHRCVVATLIAVAAVMAVPMQLLMSLTMGMTPRAGAEDAVVVVAAVAGLQE